MTNPSPADTPSNGGDSSSSDPNADQDPLPSTLREGDNFLLHFADGRQIFAQALPRWKGVKGFPPCKIQKRKYSTHNLIGLPYGTVIEVSREEGLVVLPEGEDILPDDKEVLDVIRDAAAASASGDVSKDEANKDECTTESKNNDANINKDVTRTDNRNLIDDNTSQKLTHDGITSLLADATKSGSSIVAALVSNSATFSGKTAFSQAKYLKRKQMKYQPRCRIVRITPSTLCSAMHLKDARRICNLREDTLGQILSNANICAGQKVLVMDNAVQGIVSASCVRRMGGYGSVLSLHECQNPEPGYIDVVNRMNLTVAEKQCLKWINLGEVFSDYDAKAAQTELLRNAEGEVIDVEHRERDRIKWPAPLQPHTRDYLATDLKEGRKSDVFLEKRSIRFTRKLTRHTVLELRELIDGCRDPEESLGYASAGGSTDSKKAVEDEKMDTTTTDESDKEETDGQNNNKSTPPQQCDSLIIATKYDPTAALLRLLPYLAPSCPFVVYHEFLEPLLETFHALQNYYAPENNDEDKNDDNATTAPPMMQRRNIAANLRLTDTWFREYQTLEGRTHPNMMMSQNGGYILLGTKLCPRTGTNEIDEKQMLEIRAKVGGMRKRHKGNGGGGKNKNNKDDGGKKRKNEGGDGSGGSKKEKKDGGKGDNK